MQKIKNNSLSIIFLVLAIIVIISLTFFTGAKAYQNQEIGENNTSTIKNATSDDEDEIEIDENETSTNKEEENKNDEEIDDEDEDNGQFDAEEHWNKAENFKHRLLDVADREEDEDGEEIRDIADEQDESASTTVHTMEKVEHRNKIQTFLFGSDYKNLGVLRSEIVKTRNRLDKLDKLAERFQNATDTAEIQAQAQTLEQELTKIENFIKEQEGKFSLFGWLVKMFNK